MAMEFDKLLVTGVERGASDLHLKANSPVVLRIHGRLVPQGDLGVITGDDMDAIARRCLTERMYTQLKDGREVDSAYSVPNFAFWAMKAIGDVSGAEKPNLIGTLGSCSNSSTSRWGS